MLLSRSHTLATVVCTVLHAPATKTDMTQLTLSTRTSQANYESNACAVTTIAPPPARFGPTKTGTHGVPRSRDVDLERLRRRLPLSPSLLRRSADNALLLGLRGSNNK
jgi:hypothetical protein